MTLRFQFLKSPLYRFLLNALGFYVFWYIIYELWLHPKEHLDIWVIKKTLNASLIILKWIGYQTFSGGDRLMGIDGTSGLWMGDNCDSIELTAIFAGFILVFPGSWLKKLWFIPMGIIIIFLSNVFRMVGLSILQKNVSQKWLNFNHTYTFTIFVYGIIFLLWFWWVRKIAALNISENHNKQK
jgi:exosortase/archaeosortase family protein